MKRNSSLLPSTGRCYCPHSSYFRAAITHSSCFCAATAHTARVSEPLLRTQLVFPCRYCAHSSCFSAATARCVRGHNNVNIWLPPSPNFTLLITVCGDQWKAQFTKRILTLSFIWRSHRKFHLKHPSNWNVATLCKQDKTCECLSTRTWGPFPTNALTKVWEMYLYELAEILWMHSSPMASGQELSAHPLYCIARVQPVAYGMKVEIN
jgi:hypothetical protein